MPKPYDWGNEMYWTWTRCSVSYALSKCFVRPSNNWQVKLEIHARTRLDIHRYSPLILSGFIQILTHREILVQHKQDYQIYRLLTCGQTDRYGKANRPVFAKFRCESVTNIKTPSFTRRHYGGILYKTLRYFMLSVTAKIDSMSN